MPQTIASNVLCQFGLEMGIFCLGSLLVATLILIKIQGNLKGLEVYFAIKDWKFIKKSSKVRLYAKIFQFMIIFMLFWPLISLIAWGISVLQQSSSKINHVLQDKMPGIAILLIGICLIFWIISVLQIKWNNFQMSKITATFIIIGTFCFWGFQLVCLLLTDKNYSFYGLSAVFLMINAFFILIIVFMYFSKDSASIKEIIDNNVMEGQAINQQEEALTVDDLINKQLNNPLYFPSKNEILSVCTIFQNIENIQQTALSGGLQQFYKSKSTKTRFLILLALYLISLGVLAIYSFIVYKYTDETVLGPITSVAVVVTDFLLVFMMNTKLTNGPVEITFLVIVFRVSLFAFGGNMWFLGYCLLYLILGIYLNVHIIENYLPKKEIKQTNQQPAKTVKEKLLGLLQSAEFIQLLNNLVFWILIICLSTGAKREDIPDEGFEVYGKKYNLWMYGLASVLFNFFVLFYLCTVRIYTREQNGIKSNYSKTLVGQKLPLYYFFLLFSYGLLVFFGVIWFKIEDEESLVISSFVFLPFFYEFFLIIQFNWKLNDFKFIANITEFNKKMEKLKEKLLNQQKRDYIVKKVAEKHIQQQNDNLNNDLDRSIENAMKEINEQLNNSHIQPNQQEKLIKEIQGENIQQQQGDIIIGDMEQKQNQIIQNYQLQEDWREQNISFIRAFFTRKLLFSDYRIIFSFFLLLSFMLGYSLCVYYSSKRFELIGSTISLSIFSFMLMYMPIKQYFETLAKPSFSQVFIFILGLGINYVWGFYYYFKKTKNTHIDDNPAVYYFLYFAFMVPWVICIFFAYMKYDEGQKKFNIKTNIFLLISLLIAFGKGAYLIYTRGLTVGCSVMAFWFFFYYCILVFFFYKRNNDSFTQRWRMISTIIILSVCSLSLIMALILKDFNDFLGFSISYLILNLILLIYSIYLIYLDLIDRNRQPLFSSPWIFPIYKYDVKSQTIQKHNTPLTLFLFSCLLFLFWCISLSIWVQPVSIGITTCCLVEIFLFIIIMFISSWASYELGNSKVNINQEVIKKSWLGAKKIYLENKKVLNLQQAKSYQRYFEDKNNKFQLLQNFQRGTAEKNIEYYQQISKLYQTYYLSEKQCSNAFEVEIKVLIHFQLSIIVGSLEIKRKKMKEFLNFISFMRSHLIILGVNFIVNPTMTQIEDQYEDIMDQFKEQPTTIQSEIRKLQDKYYQIIEETKRRELERLKQEDEARKKREQELEMKIREEEEAKKRKEEEIKKKIYDEEQKKIKEQEEIRRKQEEEEKRKKYEEEEQRKKKEQQELIKRQQEEIRLKLEEQEIKKRREEEQRKQQLEEQQRKIKEQEEQKRKQQEELERKKKEQEEINKKVQDEIRKQELQEIANKPVDEIPDSIAKYKLIIEQYKQTGKQFVDKQFLADNENLDGEMAQQCNKWRRPQPDSVLFKDGITPMDIKQGSIGDCYFMSAISVLGDQRVRDAFLWDDPQFDKQAKEKCGAYIVRYYINNKVRYIIVDDILPYNCYSNLFLGRSEDKKELWPAILEKSYAKLYGFYGNIVGGFVQQVLQEFTNGIPEHLTLTKYQDKVETFWQMLLEYRKYNYIMGAGSYSHDEGDKFTNEFGIVYQHAYCIIDVRDVDGNKLLCVRNPHGSRGAEWKGDWSDDSPKWTERLKKLVNDNFGLDGKFWMSIDDFLHQFEDFYICKTLEPPNWFKIGEVDGLWKLQKDIKAHQHPQFGINVTKQCELYVCLTTHEVRERTYAKNVFGWRILKVENGGKRKREELYSESLGGEYTQMKNSSKQISLKNKSYPYTFTLFTEGRIEGDRDNGFSLIVFCTDEKATFINNDKFDI